MAETAESGSSARVIQKLEESINQGDLYSSLQLFKTQHARAKKRGDFKTAAELAKRGAELMLSKNEINAGAELARDYCELIKVRFAAVVPNKLIHHIYMMPV